MFRRFALLLAVLITVSACRERVWAPIQAPVKITTTSLPAGTVGVPYSATLRATGGNGVYVWRLSSGNLPAGLVLDSLTGEISGTPTTATAAASSSLLRVVHATAD